MGAVDAAREVAETRTAAVYGGTLLDYQTAGAIIAVADALSARNRERLNRLSVAEAGTIAWKLVTPLREQAPGENSEFKLEEGDGA